MTKGQVKPKASPAMRQGTDTGGAVSAAKDDEMAFAEVVSLIRAARQRAAQAVNTEVVDLYWHIGQYLHHKIEADGWAKGTVVQLAAYIARREPGKRGFSAQNLWRMRQFYQAYPAAAILSTLLRELPWSSHLHILSRSKRPEEREFYLRMAAQQRWQVREVARQIDTGLFERAMLNPPKLSTVLRDMRPQAEQHFRDAYQLEFLALPDPHSEADLHRGLLQNLGRFLTELGRDFCYIGSEYPVQVGGQDFALDLPMAHQLTSQPDGIPDTGASRVVSMPFIQEQSGGLGGRDWTPVVLLLSSPARPRGLAPASLRLSHFHR